jgi:hypothetical protein
MSAISEGPGVLIADMNALPRHTNTNTHVFSVCVMVNIAVKLLKARTVEPKKQPFLGNGSETFVSKKNREAGKGVDGRC